MCGCGIGEPCYGCVCGCDHLTRTLLDYYQRGMNLSEIYQRGFLHGSQSHTRTALLTKLRDEVERLSSPNMTSNLISRYQVLALLEKGGE